MIRFWTRVALWLGLMMAATAAPAHESRPAYLEINELGTDQYTVLWRTPVNGGMVLPVRVQLPAELKASPPVVRELSDSRVETWLIRSPDGLAGQRIDFPGLQGTITDVLIRIQFADGTEFSALVHPSKAWIEIPSEQSALSVAGAYLGLGIKHILGGIDHLLFVAGLMLLVRGRKRLFWTITAFTVAHSITLALATLGFVHVPGPPVEAAIALSIVFVALEILRRQAGHPSLASEKPWLIGFSFGLLHGLGFAGALAEVGLPQDSIPLALAFFNIGVEVGQLLFVGALLLLAVAIKRIPAAKEPRWAVTLPAYVIGGTASYWLFERVAAFMAASSL